MKSKMGYIIIFFGLVLIVWGIAIIRKPHKPEIVEINQPINQKAKPTVNEKTQNDDFDENKAKGDAFEKFVVKNFSRKYFTLQEWHSDKYVDGIYAVSNHFPDMEVILILRKKALKKHLPLNVNGEGITIKMKLSGQKITKLITIKSMPKNSKSQYLL